MLADSSFPLTECNPPTQPDASRSIASLDNDTLEALIMKLDDNLRTITAKYSTYVSSIRECLQAKGVRPADLCADLMNLTAFNHTRKKRSLLSSHKTDLRDATELNGIFYLISDEYSSFLNFEVFQWIVDRHHLDNGQEEFQYPQHLKAYLNSHKISEFVEINPLLKDFSDASKEMVLKMDIESTSELAKLEKLRTAVAQILGLQPAALRLLDVEEGCVVVTFLIPSPVAEIIFSKHSVLTVEQVEEFRAWKVIWLECNDRTFSFTTGYEHQREEVRVPDFTAELCHESASPTKLQVAEYLQHAIHQKQVDNEKDVEFADLFHHEHMVFSRYDTLQRLKTPPQNHVQKPTSPHCIKYMHVMHIHTPCMCRKRCM